MSLEAAIRENTEVVRELIAAIMSSNASGIVAQAVNAADDAALTKATPPKEAAKPQPGVEAEASKQPKTAAPAELSYDDIKGPFLELCKSKGADAGRAVLKTFGAAKLPDVPREKWAEALVAIKAAQE